MNVNNTYTQNEKTSQAKMFFEKQMKVVRPKAHGTPTSRQQVAKLSKQENK
jgi:hypothetical protein